VVLCHDYQYRGEEALDPDPDLRALQLTNGDIDGDGTGLTLADCAAMSRDITGP
jgi:hypothetical protein